MHARSSLLVLGAASLGLFALALPAAPTGLAQPSSRLSEPPSARKSEPREVGLHDNFYAPLTVVVAPGDTVRWTNHGLHHTVTSQTGLWDSGPIEGGGEYSFTFTQPGTYPYHCRFHAREMQGTVIVR
jgi:plastocyanin